jgi:glycogen(starch) synthase
MTTDTVGGVWTFTRELSSGLLDKGCELILVSFGREPNDEQHRWATRMQDLFRGRFRFISSEAPLEWMQDNHRAFSEASQLLLNITEAFEIDLLHTNQFCFGALDVCIPKVLTAHSDVLSWAEACRKESLPQSDWFRRYRQLVQNGLDGAGTIIAPTRAMLDSLSRHFVLRDKCTCVIANGRSQPRHKGGVRLLRAVTAGRLWDEAKGIRMLEEVISPMPILIAGEQSLESDALPIRSPLHLLGPLAEEDLVFLFAESAIYICSSKYEPFGLAPLEGALCGCAVLLNDLPSLREIWGDSALYFRDAASLSALLSDLYTDPSLLEDVQIKCYARAQRYSRERMTSAYFQLYRRLSEQAEECGNVA